jgi:hypothetical protein
VNNNNNNYNNKCINNETYILPFILHLEFVKKNKSIHQKNLFNRITLEVCANSTTETSQTDSEIVISFWYLNLKMSNLGSESKLLKGFALKSVKETEIAIEY